MASLEYVAEQMDAYGHRESPIEMTGSRLRALRGELSVLRTYVEFGIKSGQGTLTQDVMEQAGEMEFMIDYFYPNGGVPAQLRPYADLAKRVTSIESVRGTVDAKLRRDNERLENLLGGAEAGTDAAVLESIEDPLYASGIVRIAEADELTPEQSRVIVTYGGEELYEASLPPSAFPGLPERSTIVFEYTAQGLVPDLEVTLDRSKDRVEQVVLDSLAHDIGTKGFVDDVYEEIQEELTQGD